MKRVIIVHGYTGNPGKNWFPWLKNELEILGIGVLAPEMPYAYMPRFKKWLSYLQQEVGEVDEDTYLVGHSLGCPTILRFLESLPEDQRVGGVVLVAGFAEPIDLRQLNGFTIGNWNDARIKCAANEIVVINSDNDKHIPFEIAERMRDRLDAKLKVLHDAGHIDEKSGYKTVPFVLDELKRMMGI